MAAPATELQHRGDLWDALALEAGTRAVVAIVGGGGKTSLLYALGREAAARGVHTLLGGTTRFTRPDDAPPLVHWGGDSVSEVKSALEAHGVIVVSTGNEPQERLGALEPAQVSRLATLPDLGLIALEADGSRMRPFKAPGEREPVIPAEATHVIAVVGADAVDAPLDEAHVHRPDRVRVLLDAADASAERCTVEVIARVLLHPEGGRRGVEGRRFVVVVNKADAHPDPASRLARALIEGGAPRVVVAAFASRERPVLEVLELLAGPTGS